jgi:hypothetical protein
VSTLVNIITAEEIGDAIARNLRELLAGDARTLTEIAALAWPDRSTASGLRQLHRLKARNPGKRAPLCPVDAAALSRALGVDWTDLYCQPGRPA